VESVEINPIVRKFTEETSVFNHVVESVDIDVVPLLSLTEDILFVESVSIDNVGATREFRMVRNPRVDTEDSVKEEAENHDVERDEAKSVRLANRAVEMEETRKVDKFMIGYTSVFVITDGIVALDEDRLLIERNGITVGFAIDKLSVDTVEIKPRFAAKRMTEAVDKKTSDAAYRIVEN
jgi:hypothetical protein